MSEKSTSDKLVYMANQIGLFFVTQDKTTTSAKIAEHLKKYWDPRMRNLIIAHLEAGGAGLSPYARDAVEKLRAESKIDPTAKSVSSVKGTSVFGRFFGRN